MTNTDRTYRSTKYRLPPSDRLPAPLRDQADQAHALREAWMDAEEAALIAERDHTRARPTERAQAAQRAAEAREAATAARGPAQRAYDAIIDALRAEPDAATEAAEALPEALTAKVARLRADLDAARWELTESMRATAWVAGVIRPRTRSTADPRNGYTSLPPRRLEPDNALDLLREGERKHREKFAGLYGVATA